MKNKKTRFSDMLTLVLCAAIIVSVGLGVYLPRKSDFSEEENRALARFPSVSAYSLYNGELLMGISCFYSDSLPLRTLFVRAKAICELSLGKGQNNDILFLKNGRLADRCEYQSTELLTQNLQLLSELSSSADCAVCLVPRSVDVYTSSPRARELVRDALFPFGDDGLLLSLERAAQGGERVYYKTDHHLDFDGAYILYTHVAKKLGVTPLERSAVLEQTVCEDFLGSAYSRCGLVSFCRDTVTVPRFLGDGDYTVSCDDPDCAADSLFCFEALEKKDKYAVFAGGNHDILKISSAQSSDRPTLLLIKDSFANAILPLLARHFDLVVYDPRYTSSPLPNCDLCAAVFGIDTLATTKIQLPTQSD